MIRPQFSKYMGVTAPLVLSLVMFATANGQRFELDFETDPAEEGVEFYGNAEWREEGGVEGSGYLSVTDAANGQKGAIEIPPLFEGALTGAFKIEADLRVGGGTARPADGFSFNFVRPDDPLIGTGDGYAASPANEANLPEEGSTTGFGIGFDEWQSGPVDPDADPEDEESCGSIDFDCVGISVRIDNELLIQAPFPILNGAVDDEFSLQTGEEFPLEIDEIEEGGLDWAPFSIEMSEENKLTVTYKGRTVIDEIIDYERHEGTFIFGGRTGGANAAHHIDNLAVTLGRTPTGDDYNGNGVLDAGDLDVHAQWVKDGNLDGDRNGDGVTDNADRVDWIKTAQGSWVGDSNFDGEFNSTDFVFVFTAGKYENGEMAGYAEGDWDGNMTFDSGDFVFAFTDGGYEQGPVQAAVPEPSSIALLLLGALALVGKSRRR